MFFKIRDSVNFSVEVISISLYEKRKEKKKYTEKPRVSLLTKGIN